MLVHFSPQARLSAQDFPPVPENRYRRLSYAGPGPVPKLLFQSNVPVVVVLLSFNRAFGAVQDR